MKAFTRETAMRAAKILRSRAVGESYEAIAKSCECSVKTVYNVIRGRTWVTLSTWLQSPEIKDRSVTDIFSAIPAGASPPWET